MLVGMIGTLVARRVRTGSRRPPSAERCPKSPVVRARRTPAEVVRAQLSLDGTSLYRDPATTLHASLALGWFEESGWGRSQTPRTATNNIAAGGGPAPERLLGARRPTEVIDRTRHIMFRSRPGPGGSPYRRVDGTVLVQIAGMIRTLPSGRESLSEGIMPSCGAPVTLIGDGSAAPPGACGPSLQLRSVYRLSPGPHGAATLSTPEWCWACCVWPIRRSIAARSLMLRCTSSRRVAACRATLAHSAGSDESMLASKHRSARVISCLGTGRMLAMGRNQRGVVVTVEDGFDGEGVVAPHGPAGGGRRGRTEPVDEIRVRFVGEGADPVGAGVVEGAVELREGGFEGGPRRGAVGDRLATLVLIMRDGIQPFTEILFGRVRLFVALPGDINQSLIYGHRFVIV